MFSFCCKLIEARHQESNYKAAIEKITEICDQLMSIGYFDVYEENRHQMSKKIEASRSGGQQCKWEYRWEAAGEIYGPFTGAQMEAWRNANCFPNGVLARKIVDESKQDFVFTTSPFQ